MRKYNIPDSLTDTEISLIKGEAALFTSGIDAIRHLRNHLCIPLRDAKALYDAEVDHAAMEANSRKLAMHAAAPDLVAALIEVREMIDGYVDIRDGGSDPIPNDAMRAQQVIDAALRKARGEAA